MKTDTKESTPCWCPICDRDYTGDANGSVGEFLGRQVVVCLPCVIQQLYNKARSEAEEYAERQRTKVPQVWRGMLPG